MATPSTHIDVLLQAANSDLPDDIPWSALKFTLQVTNINTTTIDEAEAMNLFRNIRRAIEEERKDGMRDASREHIAAVLVLANRQDLPNDNDIAWSTLRFWLTASNAGIAIPDSADWLRSFKRFRRTIAGEEVEQDNPEHTPQPSGLESAHSDSAYDSHFSESDLECVLVFLDTCEKYKTGRLSLPYAISENNEKHFMLKSASRRCGFHPDQDGVVSFTYCSKDNPEPSEVLCEVIEDHLEEADIVFSQKLLDADKKRNSSATLSSEQRRSRDHSRSAGSSAEYFEEEDQATSYAIGVALQSPAVRNLSDMQIANLGYKAELATRAARKARGR